MTVVDILLTVIIGAALITLLVYPFLPNGEKDEGAATCGITGGKCTGEDPSCACMDCIRPVGCPNCDHYRSCK